MKRRRITVTLTDAEAVAVLVALDFHANERDENDGSKDAATTRATRKIEKAREASANGRVRA